MFDWFHNGFLIFPVANLAHNSLTLLFADHSVSPGFVQMETQLSLFPTSYFQRQFQPCSPMTPQPPQKKKIEPPYTEAKIRAEMATT